MAVSRSFVCGEHGMFFIGNSLPGRLNIVHEGTEKKSYTVEGNEMVAVAAVHTAGKVITGIAGLNDNNVASTSNVIVCTSGSEELELSTANYENDANALLVRIVDAHGTHQGAPTTPGADNEYYYYGRSASGTNVAIGVKHLSCDDFHVFKGWKARVTDFAFDSPPKLGCKIASLGAEITYSSSTEINVEASEKTGFIPDDAFVLYGLYTGQYGSVWIEALYNPLLSFDSNGGTSFEPIEVESGASVVLPSPVRDGFEFAGWYEDGELTKFAGLGGSSYVVSEGKCLYAKWNQTSPIVTFDANGGLMEDGSSVSTVIIPESGGVIASAPEVTRAGYYFLGWFDEPVSGFKYIFPLEVSSLQLKLYAHWAKLDGVSGVWWSLSGGGFMLV